MNLIAFICLVTPAWFFGRALLRLKIFPILSNGESVIFSLCLGLGSTSLFVFALGIAHQINQIAIFFLLTFMLIIGLLYGRDLIQNLTSVLQFWHLKSGNILILCAMVLFIASAVVFLPACFLPCTNWDSQAAYLEISKLYLENGGIIEIPEIIHSYFCLNFQLIHAALLSFHGNDITLQLLQWFIAIATGIALVLFGYKLHSMELGWASAALYITQRVVLDSMYTAKGDLGTALFGLCGIWAAWKALSQLEDRESVKWAILTGVCIGFAAGFKTTAIAVIGVVSILVFGYGVASRRLKESTLFILLIFFISFLIVSPWYIRNFLWTGDPIYPYLSRFFEGKVFIYKHFEKGFLSFFLLPWNLSFDKRPYDVLMEPYFLAFLPSMLLFRRFPKWVFIGLIYIFLYIYTFYFFASIRMRLLLPMLPVISLITGWFICQYFVLSKRYLITIIPCLAIACGILFPVYYQARLSVPVALNYISGSLSKEEYLSEKVQPYKMYEYIDKNLDANSKIIAPYELRSYYCPRKLVSVLLSSQKSFRPIDDKQNPDKMIEYLLENGFTHVLINKNYVNEIKKQFKLGYIDKSILQIWLPFKNILSKLSKIHNVNDIYLYKIEKNYKGGET